jgi:hypothetical protein
VVVLPVVERRGRGRGRGEKERRRRREEEKEPFLCRGLTPFDCLLWWGLLFLAEAAARPLLRESP